MAKLDRLRVLVRVFGREGSSSNNVYVGTFTAWLPQIPAVGWTLNASELREVNWEEPTTDAFRDMVTAKKVAYGDGLVVRRIGVQLDDEGSCDAVRVDVTIESADPTTSGSV